MKVVEITLKTTIVAQFAPSTIKAIVDSEGTVFLPAMNIPIVNCAGCGCEDKNENGVEEKTPVKETKKEAPVVKNKSVKTYTDDELQEMKAKDLEILLRESYGIEPDDFDGKNTNKKLRGLVLEAQGGVETKEDAKEEANDAEEVDDKYEAVAKAIEDFEEGVSKKKTAAAIAEILPEMDKDAILEILEEFEDSKDMKVDDVVAKLMGDTEKEEKSGEELVEADDLKKGDKISVYWNDENKSWFNGEVSSITRKGKVMVDYEDGTSEEIDPEIHTKIKLLS